VPLAEMQKLRGLVESVLSNLGAASEEPKP
jgi:hypothetical protein